MTDHTGEYGMYRKFATALRQARTTPTIRAHVLSMNRKAPATNTAAPRMRWIHPQPVMETFYT